jgi:GT2 family glycosyltransferase
MSQLQRNPAFPAFGFPSVRVQSILYNLSLKNVERSLVYLNNAARNAKANGAVKQIFVAYGDCSSDRTFTEEILAEFRLRFTHLSGIEYAFFNANLGSAAGHNRLLTSASTDLLMILNPDVLPSPTLFEELIADLGKPGVGLVEARQIPIEHQKDFDLETGETSWASTACAMGPTRLFHELNGFDSDTFFLYCDDVDFSWRIRLAGYKVVHTCGAFVFHDKRVNHTGGWISGDAERYFSAEAGLLLPFKYSRPDITEKYLDAFRNSNEEPLLRAAAAFELRQKTNRLPEPIDQDHVVGQFIEGAYARHRFAAR